MKKYVYKFSRKGAKVLYTKNMAFGLFADETKLNLMICLQCIHHNFMSQLLPLIFYFEYFFGDSQLN